MSWYGLAGNTKKANYEKLYVMYMYMYVCMHAESVWLIKNVGPCKCVIPWDL